MAIEKERKHVVIENIIAVLVLILCEVFFFRNVISPDALISDRLDSRLTTILTEHWWNFFCGRERFSELAMFYPDRDAIGYTDLLLLYGIIHSFFRILGFNIYWAYKYTLILVHVFGTASMYYMMKRKLSCNNVWSLFGTIAFCFSNAYAIHISHTQLNAISFLPFLLILFIGFIECFESRIKRNIYGYCLVVWFVLLTYNSWYVACFTGLFCLLFLIVYVVMLKKEGEKLLLLGINVLSVAWKDFIGYGIVMTILYIPFINIYLPVMMSTQGYKYEMVTLFIPEIADIINVGKSNYMLGWLIDAMGFEKRGYSGEVVIGFSIVLLTLFFVSCKKNKKQYVQYKLRNHKKDLPGRYVKIAIRSLIIATIIGVLLDVRLSANGVSFWWLVYTFIPAMKSMRAASRFMLWLSFPIAVMTSFLCNQWFAASGKKKQFVSVIVVVLLAISNINKTCVRSSWDAKEELSFISNVSEPPSEMESFYIIDTTKENANTVIYQLDAFEIANCFGTKTINGYSGNLPRGWEGINDPLGAQYESSIFNWIKKYGLERVYAYDCAKNIWIPFEQRLQNDIIEDCFWPEVGKFSASSGLEDWRQGESTWTNQEFETIISNPHIKETGLVIRMRTSLCRYLLQNPEIEPEMAVYVDGKVVQNVTVNDDEMIELVIPMQDHVSDIYNISIRTNCFFVPKDIGESEDERRLSVALFYIGDGG